MIYLYKQTKTLNIEGKLPFETGFYVPQEVVLNNPQFINLKPIMGWRLYKWFHENKVLSYEDFQNMKDFRGTSNYNEIILVEDWQDYGSDGHIYYEFKGWVCITQKDLIEIKRKIEEEKEQGWHDNFPYYLWKLKEEKKECNIIVDPNKLI